MSITSKDRYKKLNAKERATLDAVYEFVFLLRHDISEQDAIDFCKHIHGIITANGGSVKKSEYWGLRQLAYKINKNSKAHYYFWQISSTDKLNVELARIFGVNDKALRHFITRTAALLEVPSAMMVNLQDDITNGVTIFNDNYAYNA